MSLAKFERKRVEDLLVDHGLVSAEVLAKSQTEAQDKGVGLVSLLAQENRVVESDVAQLLAKEYQLPFIKASTYELQRDALGDLPRELVARDGFVPLDRIGKTLVCAVADPPTPERAAALARLLAGPVQCYITTISEAAKALGEHFRDLLQGTEVPLRGLAAGGGPSGASDRGTPAPKPAAALAGAAAPKVEPKVEPAAAAAKPETRKAAAAKPVAADFEADKQSLVIKAKVGSRASMLEAQAEARPRLQPMARAVVGDDEPPLFVRRALARQQRAAASAPANPAAPAAEPTPTPAPAKAAPVPLAPKLAVAPQPEPELRGSPAASPIVPAEPVQPSPLPAPPGSPAPVTREAAPAPKPPDSFEFEFE